MTPVRLLLLFACTVHSLPQRPHLHAEAQAGLSRSALRHNARRASRAAKTSNFGRFLSGLPHTSAGACDGSNSSVSPVIAVATFGGDPTGMADSAAAFDAALAAAIAQTAPRLMASKIRDLGGVRIDLQGGDYALSRPFAVPQWLGNFKISGGSVRALPSFPRDRYLIEIGGDGAACAAADHGQKSCNANVGIEDLLVDGGNGTALGGIELNQTMGGNVGPDLYVIGFNRSGLTVRGGHEVMVHEAWFGTTYYDHKDKVTLGCNATAVELFGNDHVVSDVVVFAGQTGVRTTGGANLIEGVHTWNSGTLAPPCTGHGIIVEAPSTRLLNVYLDYTSLLIASGAKPTTHVSVADSFFLGMGTIVLQATDPKSKIEGLVLTDNTWNNFNMPHNATVVVDERHGNNFSDVLDFVMQANVAPKAMFDARATTVTKELALVNATRWDFNFSDALVFPSVGIASARYSIEVDGAGSFARHASRKPVGQTVCVETDVPVTAKVTMTVTQSRFTVGNGLI